MKLEVGMYVRTEYGIEKIKLIDENFMDGDTTFIATDKDEFRGAYNGKLNGFTTGNNVIKKASHNIIDLIEVGDYVNGYKVVDIKIFSDGNKYVVIATEKHQSFWKDKVFEDEIKSIVTKEQFESISYKVEVE